MTTRWDFRDFVIVGEDVESSTFNGIIDNLSEDDAAIVTRSGDIPYASDANLGQVLGVSGEAVGSVLRSTSRGLAWEAPQESTSSSQNNVTFGRFKRYLGLPRSNALSFISVDDVDEDSATINVSIDNVTGGTETVYLRFRIRGAVRWSTTRRQNNVLRSTSFSLTNLDENTIYEVQVSLFSGFSEFLSSVFLTERALNIENGFGIVDTFDLRSDQGIELLCSNDYVYIGGSRTSGNNAIYHAYRKEDGERVWSRDIIIPYARECSSFIDIGSNLLYFSYYESDSMYLGSYDLLTYTISTSPVQLNGTISGPVMGIYVENDVLHLATSRFLYRFDINTGDRLTQVTGGGRGLLSDGIYLWSYSEGEGTAFRLDTHERVSSQDFNLSDSYGDFNRITNNRSTAAVYDGIDLYALIILGKGTEGVLWKFVIGKYNWRSKLLNLEESIHIYHDLANLQYLTTSSLQGSFIYGGTMYLGGGTALRFGDLYVRPYNAYDLNSYQRLPEDDIFNDFGGHTIYDGTNYFGFEISGARFTSTLNKYSLSNGVVTVVDTITLPSERRSYGRIYSDGTYLWVISYTLNNSNRASATSLFAIEIDSMTRDTSMDISIGNTVYGSWCLISDDVLFWVLEGKVLRAVNKTSGARVSTSDITLLEDSRSIVSDGVTVWAKVVHGFFYRAYTLATGARDFEKDFMLYGAQHAAFHDERLSFVADDNYMYINYSALGDYTPAFSRATGDVVPTEGLYVYARHGWINSSGVLYYYEGVNRRLHLYDIATRTVTATRTQLAGTGELGGLWGDEVTSLLWAVVGGTIRAYDLDTYVEDVTKRIDISNRFTRRSLGLASNGSTFWVADRRSDTLYAYDISTLSADASKDIDITSKLSSDTFLSGIWTDGVRMYVLVENFGNIVTYDLPV